MTTISNNISIVNELKVYSFRVRDSQPILIEIYLRKEVRSFTPLQINVYYHIVGKLISEALKIKLQFDHLPGTKEDKNREFLKRILQLKEILPKIKTKLDILYKKYPFIKKEFDTTIFPIEFSPILKTIK